MSNLTKPQGGRELSPFGIRSRLEAFGNTDEDQLAAGSLSKR